VPARPAEAIQPAPEPTTAPPPPAAPAGWYPATDSTGTLRWWDGNAWTEHRAQRP
jgi:hypothetical protein